MPAEEAPQPAKPLRQAASVRGVVQGVGFRPFVHNLAVGLGLTGRVANTAAGVELAVQGQPAAVEEFFRRLMAEAPPLARILAMERRDEPVEPDEADFAIAASAPGLRRALISPDAAVCDQCLAELRDPHDRRHRYPFINCTHCGPRYTIIKDLPYDRPQTTMAGFTMCPTCQAEYDDPQSRRFHAQPNACPDCGPRLWLAGPDGVELGSADPVHDAALALRAGQIVAIKGLGGFHLAADAFDQAAVARLRARKHREEKPLALMAPDLAAARRLVELDPVAEEALTSRERPIVLAPMRPDAGVAPAVNPNNRLLGVMLPYTPLHHLLMDEGFAALVMTSGNVSDEPICLDNDEAVCRIGGKAARGAIADLFLLHDREIYLRGDDSVVRPVGGRLRQVRRSRGFAPAPVLLKPGATPPGCPPVLAVGGLLKNTLCLLRGDEAFLSQHVGDLENLETLGFFELTADHLGRILDARPGLIACDQHPDYLSTRWALEQDLPVVSVQHHHAHAVAVMAEHGLKGPCLALSLDGTGHGPDQTVWGGELLLAEPHAWRRLGRLRTLSLPGGEAAVREPWRVGLALLIDAFGEDAARLGLDLVGEFGDRLEIIEQMKAKGLNTPAASSLGRLFDGVAAVCGLRHTVAYEGQAAVELEQAMTPGEHGAYSFPVVREQGLLVLDWRLAVREVVADRLRDVATGVISARFHQGLLEGLAQLAREGADQTGVAQICLGGGCFMNAFLLAGLPLLLRWQGLSEYTPALVPAGDGGLSLGQAVAAAAAWGRGLVTGRRLDLSETAPEATP
ncbi:MAG: carbamoyltransferase HypF [Thermodesulfobacteriota bacterium]